VLRCGAFVSAAAGRSEPEGAEIGASDVYEERRDSAARHKGEFVGRSAPYP